MCREHERAADEGGERGREDGKRKKRRQAKGSDGGKRQRQLEGVFLQLTYSSQFYSQA